MSPVFTFERSTEDATGNSIFIAGQSISGIGAWSSVIFLPPAFNATTVAVPDALFAAAFGVSLLIGMFICAKLAPEGTANEPAINAAARVWQAFNLAGIDFSFWVKIKTYGHVRSGAGMTVPERRRPERTAWRAGRTDDSFGAFGNFNLVVTT